MGFAVPTDGKGQRGNVAAPTINVTPLVDVVLVLLIIFMVVTPLLSKEFKIHLPKKDDTVQDTPPPPEDTRILLTVDKTGTIRINRDIVPGSQLGEKLPRMLAARTDKVVYFDADDDAPYATVVETMDLARRGGAATIAILTEKVTQ